MRHPLAVAVDPNAGSPQIIGSTWVRREPTGDEWDGPVRIVGLFDTGNDHNGIELCVQTVAFTGQPTLTADSDSFVAAYKREVPDDQMENLRARVADLEARSR